MSKKLRLVAALGAMALLLSSCLFSIKGFSVSRRTIGPGDTAVVTLKLYPTFNSASALKGVPFLIVAQNDVLPQMTYPSTGRKFDVKENYGSAPRSLQMDNVMRDLLIAEETPCGGYDEITSGAWNKVVFRTEGEINVKNKVNKVALTKIPMKLPGTTDMTDIPALLYVVISGVWRDNPDAGTVGTPDAEDSFDCNSAIFSDFANEVATEPEEAKADAKALKRSK